MQPVEPHAFNIDTHDLNLRPIQPADEAFYCSLYTNPTVMYFVAPALTPDQAQRGFLKTLDLMQARPMACLLLVIVDRTTQRPVGLCGVPQFDADANTLEIGVMLLPDAQGKGYAKQSKIGLMQRLFSALPANEICIRYQPENSAAARSNRSIGFLPSALPCRAETSGTCRMSVMRQMWCTPDGCPNPNR